MAKTQTLRFAALRRVSTETQAEKGESLRVQESRIVATVKQLNGRVVEWYGGQEHGTPGWEKKEVERLLSDSGKKPRPFDAVIVQHADRWSRDNVASSTGLDRLLASGVQYFYVLTDRHDLLNPDDRFRLAFHALIAEFLAKTSAKKSIEARIHRAERGRPTCGKLPYGRLYDPKAEQWSVDREKKRLMEKVAKRYLAGESMVDLADEVGMNHANLHKTLMSRCGPIWSIRFSMPKLNIDQEVAISVPPLLDDDVIRKLQARAQANKTYSHGEIKNKYLLSRMIFCAHCGYAMFGQTNKGKHRYYRHAHQRRTRPCTCDKCWVRADVVEENVIRRLFDAFGNPKALERAMEQATPNLEALKELQEQRDQLLERKAKNERQRERTRRHERNETITEDQAAKEYSTLKESDAKIDAKLQQIDMKLTGAQSASDRRNIAEKASKKLREVTRMRAFIAQNVPVSKMSWVDRRELCESVFGGTSDDGKRLGVYITFEKPRKKQGRHIASDPERPWRFSLTGHLINSEGLLPFTSDFFDEGSGLTSSALQLTSTSPSWTPLSATSCSTSS